MFMLPRSWSTKSSDPAYRVPGPIAVISLAVGMLGLGVSISGCGRQPVADQVQAATPQQHPDDWVRAAECSAQGEKLLARKKIGLDQDTLINLDGSHYSHTLARCFVMITTSWVDKKEHSSVNFENLYEGFDGFHLAIRDYAMTSRYSFSDISCSILKKPWERGSEADKVDCSQYWKFVAERMAN